MSKVKPVSPKDSASVKLEQLPDMVVESFNELIVEKLDRGYAKVTKEEVITRMMSKSLVTRNEILNNGWLNVEEVFKLFGWKVKYTSPDYTESFDSYYEFEDK